MAMQFSKMELFDFKDLTTVQGGADTFVCTAFDTGIDRAKSEAWFIHSIEWRPIEISEVDSSMEVQLAARVKTALCTEDDYDLIWHKELRTKITTSGMIITEWPHIDKKDLIVMCDPLYLIIGSTSTGLTNRVRMRVNYEIRIVPEKLRYLAWM